MSATYLSSYCPRHVIWHANELLMLSFAALCFYASINSKKKLFSANIVLLQKKMVLNMISLVCKERKWLTFRQGSQGGQHALCICRFGRKLYEHYWPKLVLKLNDRDCNTRFYDINEINAERDSNLSKSGTKKQCDVHSGSWMGAQVDILLWFSHM